MNIVGGNSSSMVKKSLENTVKIRELNDAENFEELKDLALDLRKGITRNNTQTNANN